MVGYPAPTHPAWQFLNFANPLRAQLLAHFEIIKVPKRSRTQSEDTQTGFLLRDTVSVRLADSGPLRLGHSVQVATLFTPNQPNVARRYRNRGWHGG